MLDTTLKTQHSKHLISGGYNNNNEKKEGREEEEGEEGEGAMEGGAPSRRKKRERGRRFRKQVFTMLTMFTVSVMYKQGWRW